MKQVFKILVLSLFVVLVGCDDLGASPVIDVEDVITIKANDEFDLVDHVVVEDLEDKFILFSDLEISYGGFDNSAVGTYAIIITATDSDGNETIKEISVIVGDDVSPVILYDDPSTISIGYGSDIPSPNVTCTDNVDDDCDLVISGDIVDPNTMGTYVVVYTATDDSMNESSIEITYIVKDVNPPVVTLVGESSITIYDLNTFVDLGVTFNDDLDDDPELIITNPFEEEVEYGTYIFWYSVVDESGNVSTVTRTVIYEDLFKDVCLLDDYEIVENQTVINVMVTNCDGYTFDLDYTVDNTTPESTPITLSIYSDGVLVREKLATYTVLANEVDMANVAVFVRFSDETDYNAPFSVQEYEDMFNGDMTSVQDYFLEVSNGTFLVETYFANDVTAFYTDIYERGYYQMESNSNPVGYKTEDEGNEREHALIDRIAKYIRDNDLIDPTLDLDGDDDGELDSFTVIFSYGPDDWMDVLWPHAWGLHSSVDEWGYWFDDAVTLNDVYVYDYNIEFLGLTGEGYNDIHIGVLAHELFHLVGAPDFYHYYEDTDIEPVGYWGLMESQFKLPSHMLGFTKEEYGGFEQDKVEITEDGTYTINRTTSILDNLAFIDLGRSNEYLYIEYRTKATEYEESLLDEGLLVYRIDQDYLGNEDGYYSTSGEGKDEVFIFRPVTIDQNEYDNNGIVSVTDFRFIDDAIMNDDTYSSIGYDTGVYMFYSDGEEIMITITITNTTEDNITFTVDFIE